MLRQRGYLVENWIRIKKFIPGVKDPLFHATTAARAHSILAKKQGIKRGQPITGSRAKVPEKYMKKMGVSFTRSIEFLLNGMFGPYIIVVDKSKLRGGKLKPVKIAAAKTNEYEERYFGNVSYKSIGGVVMIGDPWDAAGELGGLDVPIVHYEGGKFELFNPTMLFKSTYKRLNR